MSEADASIFHIAVMASRYCKPNHKVFVPGSPSALRPRNAECSDHPHCFSQRGWLGGRHRVPGDVGDQRFPFRILEVDHAGHIGDFSAQLGQVENAPSHHQINRQGGFDAVGGNQLSLLNAAAARCCVALLCGSSKTSICVSG